MSATIDRLESTVWLGVAALAAAMSVRLFTVLASESLGTAADHFSPPPGPSVQRNQVPVGRQRQEELLKLAQDDPDGGAPTKEAAVPELIHPKLYIDVGAERSKVFVNGSYVGHTPYIGEVGCRVGELVEVDVDPPVGLPLHFTGRCEGTTLTVKKSQ